MEYYKLRIISLKCNSIIYKQIKHKKQNKNIIFSLVIFLTILCSLFSLKFLDINNFNQIMNTAAYLQNPVNPLYSDMGNIVFTSGYSVYRLKNKELNFDVPLIYKNVNQLDNSLEFTTSTNLVLNATEDGVVSDIFMVGTNVKCIKIKHSNNVFSIIENIDILGVVNGQVVKQGQNIGMLKADSTVKMYIIVGGQYKQLQVIDDKVKCVN